MWIFKFRLRDQPGARQDPRVEKSAGFRFTILETQLLQERMPFALVSVIDFYQGIGQLVLLSGGDEDDPIRGERLPDKSKNQSRAPWPASQKKDSAIPSPRRRVLASYSHNASRNTMSPTTSEPKCRMVPWRKGV